MASAREAAKNTILRGPHSRRGCLMMITCARWKQSARARRVRDETSCLVLAVPRVRAGASCDAAKVRYAENNWLIYETNAYEL